MAIHPHEEIYRVNPECDSARLDRILARCKDWLDKQCRLPLTIGHTEGNEWTPYLPIDIGHMNNFVREGDSLYADLDVDEAFEEAAKRHRAKSAEVYDDDLLYCVCLLAKNRPRLPLPPMKFEMPDGMHKQFVLDEPAKFAVADDPTAQTLEDNMGSLDASAVKNLISECLLESEVYAQQKDILETIARMQVQLDKHTEENEQLAWLRKPDEMMDEDAMNSENGEMEPEQNADPDASNVSAESGGTINAEQAMQEAADNGAKPKEKENKMEKEENALGMAIPSGTNTFVPGTQGMGDDKGKKKKNYAELEMEVSRLTLERDQQAALVTAYQDKMANTLEFENQKIAGLEDDRRLLVRKNALQDLARIYVFDVEEETQLIKTMTDEQFQAHCSKVVTKYAKPPIGRPGVVVGQLDAPKLTQADDTEVISRETVVKVAKYAESSGLVKKFGGDGKLAWDQAYRELHGGKDPPRAQLAPLATPPTA